MATSADPRIGSVLVGYRIEELLGRGGMSVVYRAEDLALERKVALKLLAPELAEEEGFRERFQRESRLAASLDHPGVVPVYEAGEVQGQLYIAMRYVEGTDLRVLLRDEGPMEPERAVEICSQLADALDEAHEHGLVHRDVKPSNVLIDGRGRCYLADFGLTKRAGEQTDLTGAGQLMGSSDYIAPEAVEGESVDGRADVYALGCLLYHCIAGKPPFPRDSELSTLWAHVHDPPPKLESAPELDPVIAKALAKDPDKRYPTAPALTDAAEAALPHPEPEQPSRRRRVLLAAVAALFAIAVAAVLAVLLTGDDAAPAPGTEPTLSPTTDSIQRIDPETNEVVATIAAPVSERGIAVGGGSVWTASVHEGAIGRIDSETNAIIETISGVGTPSGIAAAGDSVWVNDLTAGVVTKLDVATGAITERIPLPEGASSTGLITIRANEDGAWLRRSTPDTNAVFIDEAGTRPVALQLGPPGPPLFDIAFTGPDEIWASLYVVDDEYETRLFEVDPRQPGKTGLVIPVTVTDWVCAVGSEDAIWVADISENAVFQVDHRAGRVVRRIDLGATPCGIAIGHGSVWVASSGSGTVSRIDPESGEVVATIEVGPNAWGIAADENAVWVDVHPEAS